MKKITSLTFFDTAAGTRMSSTYSVIDEETCTVVEDNKRDNSIVLDPAVLEQIAALKAYAQARIDSQT